MKHRCLASFIVFVLFFSILAFIGFSEVKSMLSAKFVAKFLEKSQVYNNLDDIGRQIANSSADEQSKTLILAITQNLDPLWIKKEINTNLTPLFDYLWGKSKKLNIVIDTTPFKNRLPANFSSQIEELLKSMPACPPEQTTQTTTTEENAPPCLSVSARNNLQALAQLPNQINLSDYVKNPDSFLDRTKLSFRAIKIGYWVSLILSLLLLGCLVLLGLGWWPSILRWTGLSLVLPSGFALLTDLLWKVSQISLENRYLPTLSAEVRPIVIPIINAFSSEAFRTGIILAGVIFLIGVTLIILSYALPHPPSPPSQGSPARHAQAVAGGGVAGGPAPKPQAKTPTSPKPATPAPAGLTEAK